MSTGRYFSVVFILQYFFFNQAAYLLMYFILWSWQTC